MAWVVGGERVVGLASSTGLPWNILLRCRGNCKTGSWKAKQLGIPEFYTLLSYNKPYCQWPQHHTTAVESSNCTVSLKKELHIRKQSTTSQTQMHDVWNHSTHLWINLHYLVIEHIRYPSVFPSFNKWPLTGMFGQIHVFRILTCLYTFSHGGCVQTWVISEFLKKRSNGKLNVKRDLMIAPQLSAQLWVVNEFALS